MSNPYLVPKYAMDAKVQRYKVMVRGEFNNGWTERSYYVVTDDPGPGNKHVINEALEDARRAGIKNPRITDVDNA